MCLPNPPASDPASLWRRPGSVRQHVRATGASLGRDEWLAAFHSVPPPITGDGSTSLQHAIEIRLGWLTNPALREAYLQPPNGAVADWSQADAVNLYGLPMSRPVDHGPFVSQRFPAHRPAVVERGGAGRYPAGEVTPVLAGQLAVAAELVADVARHPHAPGATVGMPLPVVESWPPALSREPPPPVPLRYGFQVDMMLPAHQAAAIHWTKQAQFGWIKQQSAGTLSSRRPVATTRPVCRRLMASWRRPRLPG